MDMTVYPPNKQSNLVFRFWRGSLTVLAPVNSRKMRKISRLVAEAVIHLAPRLMYRLQAQFTDKWCERVNE